MKRFIITLFLFIATTATAYQASISVPNGTGAQVRTNMNNALQAITTQQSGVAAPATTYAYQAWVDTSTSPPTYKIRNGANTAWISAGTLNDSGSAFIAANSALLGGNAAIYYQPASTAITTSNIGSQSVNYATSAGSATTAASATTATSATSAATATTAANVSGANRIPFAAAASFRGVLAYASSSQAAAAGIYVALGAEDYDTDAIHDNSTNNTRLTVPSGVTKVRVNAGVSFQNNATAFQGWAQIEKNHGGYPMASSYVNTTAYGPLNMTTGVISVTAGDYFELYAKSSDTRNVTGGSGSSNQHWTWMTMEIVE